MILSEEDVDQFYLRKKDKPDEMRGQFLLELAKHFPYKVQAIASGYIDPDTKITEIITVDKLLNGDYCLDSNESDYLWKSEELWLILYPNDCIYEKLGSGGKEVCVLDQIIGKFDFDGYYGIYSGWRKPNKQEALYCGENDVIVECFGGPSCIFNTGSFMAKDYKTHAIIPSDVSYYRQAIELYYRYHIDYRNMLHNSGYAVTPLNNDFYER